MIMIDEIREIPERAQKVYNSTQKLVLPTGVPYLGMGSSHFATLALFYQGVNIRPETSSTYFNYLSKQRKANLGVLISQSGRSSETLWCRGLFNEYIAITNDAKSKLASADNVKRLVELKAGLETHSSTKTYINTLIALFNGHKIETKPAIDKIIAKMDAYEEWGRAAADKLYKIFNSGKYKGVYVIGNGPNIATANQAALMLSESTKFPVIGMSVSQYDHGPKETANGSAIIVIRSNGPSYHRTNTLFKIVANAGANVIYLEEPELPEYLSTISTIMPLNFMAHFLAEKLKIEKTFEVGEKVTEVKDGDIKKEEKKG